MLRKIKTDVIRKSLGKILDSVNLHGDQFVIQRGHESVAALVPIPKLIALEKIARDIVLDMLKGSANPESQEEIDKLANEAKHQSRKQKPSH